MRAAWPTASGRIGRYETLELGVRELHEVLATATTRLLRALVGRTELVEVRLADPAEW